jgi:hypothetical protein
MKALNVFFSDEEFEAMKKIKKNTTWHDYILRVA